MKRSRITVEERKKLLKLLRHDLSDLLFHFTKTPRRPPPEDKYLMHSIPSEIEKKEFDAKLDHRWFKAKPEDSDLLRKSYRSSRDGKRMNLRRIDSQAVMQLGRVCRMIGYSSFDLRIKRPSTASGVLRKILFEKKLMGGRGGIKGGFDCICFSESPIHELSRVLALAKRSARTDLLPKYEPYGIAVNKQWLFDKGGRPVIYQPDSEYHFLPGGLKYRHKVYEPHKGADYTWEREWRIHAKELTLEPANTLVVVPYASEAWDFAYETAEAGPSSYDRAGNPEGPVQYEPTWQCVALEVLGVVTDL